MKKFYEVTVKKTLVLTQTRLIEAESRADAEDSALDLANDVNADTKDSDWKLVKVKELK